MTMKKPRPGKRDAFDLWWSWANKNRKTSYRTIPGEIHYPVMMLTPQERKDRAIVNEAVRRASASPSDRQ